MFAIKRRLQAYRPNAGSRRSGFSTRPVVYGRHHIIQLAGGVVLAIVFPILVGGGLYTMDVATTIAIYGVLSLGFYYQFSLSGHLSLATAGLYAIGAYTSVWASQYGGFLTGFVAAAVITGVVGMALKAGFARSPLLHFAIATLAFGELVLLIFRNWTSFTGGATGKYGIETTIFGYSFISPTSVYYLAVTGLLLGIGLAMLFERSPAQREIIFVKETGDVAKTVGLPALRMQIVAFGVGSAYIGAAGSLLVHTSHFVNTTSFSTIIALDVLVMVLLGGSRSVWGPVVGAAVLTVLPELMRDLAEYKNLVYALIILLVIVALPGGLTSLPRIIGERLRRLSG